ncbi:MAG: hypothetical protein LBC35_03735, partial [Coriobacteriales bacterium]|nr:hypothetical protein [Coriobacteriales bacterium]
LSLHDALPISRGLVTVKRSIEYAVAHSHLEVTTLIVPGLNDDPRQIEQLSRWLAGISADIPLHLSRFHPAYRMLDTAATPRTVVLELVDVARQYLTYVYAGNL